MLELYELGNWMQRISKELEKLRLLTQGEEEFSDERYKNDLYLLEKIVDDRLGEIMNRVIEELL